MASATHKRTGGEVLADALVLHSVPMGFAVCGESFLPLLDAIHDRPSLKLIGCRHEAGAAVMAEAYGKLTGHPGVCLVSRGPGACHALIGLHTAFQDSTPLVALIGQVPRAYIDREAQQELDYRRLLGPVTKWTTQIDRAERIPELVQRAFRTAMSGRPGPVALVLPEDVLEDLVSVEDCPPGPIPQACPEPAVMADVMKLLAQSNRPVMIVGGSPWSDEACMKLADFASANEIPVLCSYRRLDLIPTSHGCCAGELAVGTSPAVLSLVRQADLVISVGSRLSEPTTQDYTLLNVPNPRVPLVHVHPSAEELGSTYRPTCAIQASPVQFAAALTDQHEVTGERARWRTSLRQAFLDDGKAPPGSDDSDPAQIMAWLQQRLPIDSIIALDAGAFTGWPQRFLAFGRPGRILAPVSGSMNYGIAAGVGACLVHPDRRVLICVGDGGFTMGEAELATAKRYGAKPIILLFNNDRFGSVRIHQERRYPGRSIGTDLTNPDFVMLAKSYGAFSTTVRNVSEFATAWEHATQSGVASVIEIVLDPRQLSSRVRVKD